MPQTPYTTELLKQKKRGNQAIARPTIRGLRIALRRRRTKQKPTYMDIYKHTNHISFLGDTICGDNVQPLP